MNSSEETIVAIATSPGTAAIAMIRLSGTKSFDILERTFRSNIKIQDAESRKVLRGFILDYRKKNIIDDVVVVKYMAPNSYTGEAMVEITCHGGIYVTRRIIENMTTAGARIAEPGEFTKRAFINGKIDLTQAEAISDLIQARTELARKSSISQLTGGLSQKIAEIRDDIVDTRSLIELGLDFAEEDVEIADERTVCDKIQNIMKEIEKLLNTYQQGHLIREGVKLIIVGKPNVGKSSLLNALLKTDRAIVTDIPGTTRDAIEEALDIKGMLFRVIDTAGLRQGADLLEREGIKRTKKHLLDSDIILMILDGSEALTDEDFRILRYLNEELIKSENNQRRPIIFVINKIDKERGWENKDILTFNTDAPIIEISIKKNRGIEELENQLYSTALGERTFSPDDLILTNLRHWQALKATRKALERALDSIKNGLSGEFIALDLRSASDNIGKIGGNVESEDVLYKIFSKFCIGK